MIYFQIILGGITRLTGSGLSITKWEIITGTIPPLHAGDWHNEFDKYKATPQYHKLNKGMSLSEFKFIYFWEYVHRLWARVMGLVFAVPFAVFLFQKKLSRSFVKKLLVLVLLAAVVASLGWVMVKSGLVNRPWVDAYKLTLHLSLAIITYSYCWWLCLTVLFGEDNFTFSSPLRRFAAALLVVIAFQFVLGGLMSGMRAGLLYPTFPDMNGKLIPDVLLSPSDWSFRSFFHYDTNVAAPTLVQFLHRLTAYALVILAGVFFIRSRNVKTTRPLQYGINIMALLTALQVVVGILTVINFKGEAPVALGVMHQAVAILLLSAMLFVFFLLREEPSRSGRHQH